MSVLAKKLHDLADEVRETEAELQDERGLRFTAEEELANLENIEAAVHHGKGGTCIGCGRSTDRRRSIFESLQLSVCPDCDRSAWTRSEAVRLALTAVLR